MGEISHAHSVEGAAKQPLLLEFERGAHYTVVNYVSFQPRANKGLPVCAGCSNKYESFSLARQMSSLAEWVLGHVECLLDPATFGSDQGLESLVNQKA